MRALKDFPFTRFYLVSSYVFLVDSMSCLFDFYERSERPFLRISGSLPYSPLHPFLCNLSPCFYVGWPSLTFLSFYLLISLFHYSILLYLIWFLSFLIPLDVWLGFNVHLLFLFIWYVHSFIIIFHVGTPKSMTHEVFYALHLMHEGYGDYIIRIIELSFLLFLLPYYLSLRYVPCLKTTLRPWLHTFCLTAHTWAILKIGERLLLRAWWMRTLIWSTMGHTSLIDDSFFEMMPYTRA